MLLLMLGHRSSGRASLDGAGGWIPPCRELVVTRRARPCDHGGHGACNSSWS